MKNIVIIAAIGPNNELGKDNDLIWKIPEDMKFFRESTTNKPIVMGVNTFYSLPKMLPNRKHIVLTHQTLEENDNLVVFNNLEELLEFLKTIDSDIMVIGGAKMYEEFLQYADMMLLTEIENNDALADRYFPEFDREDWNSEVLGEYNHENIKYKRLKYSRK